VLLTHQEPLTLHTPQPGWAEQDALELRDVALRCLDAVAHDAARLGFALSAQNVVGLGITNQRETTVCWDARTGEPLCRALVWLDTRTKELVDAHIARLGSADALRAQCGLPLATYFSAVKMQWMMAHEARVQAALASGHARFGTVDSWLLYALTGAHEGGVHVTDVTNASRTMLLNLHTRQWDAQLAHEFGVPLSALPIVCSSAEPYGRLVLPASLRGIVINGCLGDQQAALVGQRCFASGTAKCTLGTGAFLLYNTGSEARPSARGLLTTIAYQFGRDAAPVYALEGSVAICGAGIMWLRDQLHVISAAPDVSRHALEVADAGGVVFVPALSGLFAPHWRADARGLVRGLTQHTTRAHLCRALLEGIACSNCDILDACAADSGVALAQLTVDGGVARSDVLLQLQADLLGIPVTRPSDTETTVRGAAMAAAFAAQLWTPASVPVPERGDAQHRAARFEATLSEEARRTRLAAWAHAVKLSYA